MNRKSGQIIVGIFILLIFSLNVFADTVVLKNGISKTGIIIRENESKIELETFHSAGIRTEKISRKRIEMLIKDLAENEKIIKQYVEEQKLKQEQEQIRRKAAEEQKILTEELERKRQAAQYRQEEIERRKKENEIRKEEKLKRKKEIEGFNLKVEELKATFKLRGIEDKAFSFGKITSYEKYMQTTEASGEYFTIYYKGVFYNKGSIKKKNVVVTIAFYDSQGRWLTRRSAHAIPVDIPPGENGSFEISINKTFSFTTYEVSASWDY